MVTSRCLEPSCFRVAPTGQEEAVSCCVGNYGGAMNWRCVGTQWEHSFVGPKPVDKYTGVTHDNICKDIGTIIFSERTWSGIDDFKPFGELSTNIPFVRSNVFNFIRRFNK